MNEPAPAEQLIEQYLAGLLDAAQLAELEHRLLLDPQAARLFAERAREEQRLHEHFHRERDVARVRQVLRSVAAPRRRRWLAAALALSLLIAGGTIWLRLRGPAAVVTGHQVTAGVVTIDGARAATIPDGLEFVIASDAPAALRLADGSSLELASSSRAVVRQHGPSGLRLIELNRGVGRFQVEPGPREFRVVTPAGSVSAVGTEFTVEVRDQYRIADRDATVAPLPALLVAVLSGAVAVKHREESYALTLGDDRIFSTVPVQASREPDLIGKVVAVSFDDEQSFTIETPKTATQSLRRWTVRLTDGTRRAWINVPVEHQRPSVGYSANIWWQDGDETIASDIQFIVPKDSPPPPQLTGQVIDVSPDGHTVTLELPGLPKSAPPPRRPVTLNADTDVTYFFVPLMSEQPRVGYHATVWLIAGSPTHAREIHFAGDKRGRYQPDLTGEIIAVSPDGQQLEILTREKRIDGQREVRTHIRIDDHTRLAYPNLPPTDRHPTVGWQAQVWLAHDATSPAAGIRFQPPSPTATHTPVKTIK